jgi:hypothetical protein
MTNPIRSVSTPANLAVAACNGYSLSLASPLPHAQPLRAPRPSTLRRLPPSVRTRLRLSFIIIPRTPAPPMPLLAEILYFT